MQTEQTITTRIADYNDACDAEHVLALLDHYARDPMGGGEPLSDYVKDNLISALSSRSFTFSVLAFCGDIPVGLANVIEGFSTFACKPLVNVHDLVVHKDYRGRGISHQLLAAVQQEAEARGCVKITLEVLSDNYNACESYKKFGFAPYTLDPEAGPAQFWQKYL
ncbi:GNAT family N-acetyltransferase [Alteromonas sediminis]|uniref:GNAT family N-acetyltransferase n=1 Tax=Alteromonas sediminis TaxID=2259342 RepID=A0A3N5YAN0_9ALTE|nr:GNAT family N-acetyltransferase [Alteromonas sediminis]RPJ68649.1 GNAT family N-acetyltransferase [Alteromonas sediminis]